MVTLPTKSLLFKYLVPERVGHRGRNDNGIFFVFQLKGILGDLIRTT